MNKSKLMTMAAALAGLVLLLSGGAGGQTASAQRPNRAATAVLAQADMLSDTVDTGSAPTDTITYESLGLGNDTLPIDTLSDTVPIPTDSLPNTDTTDTVY